MSIDMATLGKTSLENIFPLGYGAMELRDLKGEKTHPSSASIGRLSSIQQADLALNSALDSGVNFIDTAWAYSRSEEFIGRYISQRRQEYYLATKTGQLYRGRSNESGWSREALMLSFQESLQRMKTDYVDLLQLHNPRPEELNYEELAEFFAEVKRQGMARHVGISSGVPHIDQYIDSGLFEVIQVPFSAVFPENEQQIKRASELGIGVIARGSLAEGVPFVGDESRALYKKLKERWLSSDLYQDDPDQAVKALLQYTLSHPSVDISLFGSACDQHIGANVSLARTLLSELRAS